MTSDEISGGDRVLADEDEPDYQDVEHDGVELSITGSVFEEDTNLVPENNNPGRQQTKPPDSEMEDDEEVDQDVGVEPGEISSSDEEVEIRQVASKV